MASPCGCPCCTCCWAAAARPVRAVLHRAIATSGEAVTMPENASMLFRGARVVDPASGFDGVTDVLVADGAISAVGERLGDAGEETLECSGMVLTPGLVDLHTHLR